MATLLTMINDLRILLREEQITSISATDDYTQALIPLINKATKAVLESRTWTFDKRRDGTARFLALSTGTNLKTAGGAAVQVELFTNYLLYSNSTLMSKFRVTDDLIHPGIEYRITTLDTFTNGGKATLTLSPIWTGTQVQDVTDASYEVFAIEYVLPSTVRKVLSARDEEQPIRLEFSEKDIFQDRAQPRMSDSTGKPSLVIVGGTGAATNWKFDSTTPVVTSGMIMSIWPVPTENTYIFYDYVYSHAAMSAATDTLTGVPDNVIGLIIDQAFYYCLSSNIEADPIRASRVAKQLRLDMAIAERDDRVAPNRRRIMRPVGSYLGRHPNSRWDPREVPDP